MFYVEDKVYLSFNFMKRSRIRFPKKIMKKIYHHQNVDTFQNSDVSRQKNAGTRQRDEIAQEVEWVGAIKSL